MRDFNTTGPCDPGFHYLLPPLERAPTALRSVHQRNYVAVSGPRQSGKTSLLQAVVKAVNDEGWGRSVLVTCEPAGALLGVEDVGEAEQRLLEAWHRTLCLTFKEVAWPAVGPFLALAPGGRVGAALAEWTVASDRPLVFVIDEIDTLARMPFLSLLTQIRAGFPNRGRIFPHSVLLAGMRSLRDHDIALGGDGRGSPFNIVEFVSIGNFSRDELLRLYRQHTSETGQTFSDDAIEVVWEQTHGQPWLVNAIARLCINEFATDRSVVVAPPHVEASIRRIERESGSHLTSLTKRLEEDRVMGVVAPVVVGDAPDVDPDDVRYALELGLLERIEGDRLRAANPIYSRTLLRAVTTQERTKLSSWAPTWLVNGRIDLDRLRANFLSFWALNRNMMKDRITYPEAVAHFGLMTYLDRVVNGGGRVDREFAVGSGRLDLLLIHGDLRLPIEVKVHRDHGGDPVPAGLEQLDRYCEELQVGTAWLVVFDQRTGAPGTRLESEEVVTAGGRKALVIRA